MRIRDKTTFFLLVFILIASSVNLALSIEIESQKVAKEDGNIDLLGGCFSEGGCAIVQTSSQATTFGISNPLYGIVSFSVAILLTLFLLWGQVHPRPRLKADRLKMIHILLILYALGSVMAIRLLYTQYFILKTTCIYCLWVDYLTLAMLILLAVFFRRTCKVYRA